MQHCGAAFAPSAHLTHLTHRTHPDSPHTRQVMAAVEVYNAKTDPAFKDILARIASTLNNSLA